MIKLAQPYIPEEAVRHAAEIIRSGKLIQGECVARFEEALAEYLKADYVCVVSSGTAALHLSLLAAGVGKEDEVIVPAFTFPATANAVIHAGATPVLVDISLSDFCMDVDKIEKAITSKTRAIIPVHEFGQAARMREIQQIAAKHKLIIIEDAACALGTEFENKKAGTFGLAGCFSFHPRKNLTTGEGGLMVTAAQDFAEKVKSLRNHGIIKKEGKNIFEYSGLNYRMTEFQAAMGLAQIPLLEEQIEHRIKIAGLYNEMLADIEWITTPAQFPERKMIYQTYHIMVSNDIDRDHLMEWLRAQGIETNLGAQALNAEPCFQKISGCTEQDFPFAYQAFRQGLALPIGMHTGVAEVTYICETIKKYRS